MSDKITQEALKGFETKTPFSLELQGVAEHEDEATEITVYRTNKGDD